MYGFSCVARMEGIVTDTIPKSRKNKKKHLTPDQFLFNNNKLIRLPFARSFSHRPPVCLLLINLNNNLRT